MHKKFEVQVVQATARHGVKSMQTAAMVGYFERTQTPNVTEQRIMHIFLQGNNPK